MNDVMILLFLLFPALRVTGQRSPTVTTCHSAAVIACSINQNRLFAELLFRVSNVARIVYARAAAGAARVKACVRLRL